MICYDILTSRGLDDPDGRPLCRYEITEAELTRTIESVRAAFRGGRWSPHRESAADFCLAAAELWRTRYDGGLWTWEVVLPPLGLTMVHSDLADLTMAGLRFWKRPLLELSRREFLGSIAREAGLPLGVLTRHGGSIRDFLRALLADLRTFGAERPLEVARLSEQRLPERLRNRTFLAVATDSVLAAIDIGRQIEERSLTPQAVSIRLIDQHVPDWRARFPFRIDNHQAVLHLVAGLVDTARASTPSRPLKAVVRLVDYPDRPSLHRTLQLPKWVAPADIAAWTGGRAAELPARLELLYHGSRRLEPLAFLVAREPADDPQRRFRTEALAYLRAPWEERLVLVLRGAGRELGRFVPPGGAALTELPWVFCPDPATDADWRLVAQGSTRVGAEALVAIPPGYSPPPDRPVTARLADRALVHIAGTTTFAGPERGILVRCGIPLGERSFEWRGDQLQEALGDPIFRGNPTLCAVDDDGLAQALPPERLRVETPRGWVRWGSPLIGRHRVQLLDDDDQIVFEDRVTCIPSETHLAVTPRSPSQATVTVATAGAPHVGVVPAEGLSIGPQEGDPGGTKVFRLDASPTVSSVRVRLLWPTGADVVAAMPYPRLGARFVTPDGAPLGPTAQVSLHDLHTVVAEGWPDPRGGHGRAFRVTGTLRSRDAHAETHILGTLRATRGARLTLPLHAVARRIERLLACSSTPDATVSVRIVGGRAKPMLSVGHFGHTLELRQKAGTVHTSEPSLGVAALRIAHPDTVVTLAATSPGVHDLRPLDATPGSWMVFGMDGDRPATAPRLRVVDPPPEVSGDPMPPQPASGLSRAIELRSHRDRERAFVGVWEELASSPQDPDWEIVDAYIERLDRFPAATFEALRVLPDVPAALAAALLRSPDPAAFIRALDTLPFHWATLPERALRRAVEVQRRYLRDMLGDEHGNKAFIDILSRVRDALTSRYPGYEVAIARAVGDLPELRSAFATDLARLAREQPRVLLKLLADATAAVRRRHPDPDEWPEVHAVRELAGRVTVSRLEVLVGWKAPSRIRWVLRAAVMAGMCAAFDTRPTREQAFALRLAESFDPDYFTMAHAITLAVRRAEHLDLRVKV